MESDRSITKQVVDEFVRRGINAQYNFPGVCALIRSDGVEFWTSDMNDTWTIDRHDFDAESHPTASYDTHVLRTVTDVQFIANKIMETIIANDSWFDFRPEGE